MATVDPARLVFVDEAGILNMTRRYARAEIGERACGFAPVTWKRLTVLGALSLTGIVEVKTVPTLRDPLIFIYGCLRQTVSTTLDSKCHPMSCHSHRIAIPLMQSQDD